MRRDHGSSVLRTNSLILSASAHQGPERKSDLARSHSKMVVRARIAQLLSWLLVHCFRSAAVRST